MRSFYLWHGTANRRSGPVLSLAAVAAALTLVASGGTARAADTTITYQSAPLVMSGDRFGTSQIPANYDLFVGGLTDSGKIVFSAGNTLGTKPEMLLQWDGQHINPIVTPASGPVGAYAGDIYWTPDVIVDRPVSMNEQGSIAFTADHVGGYNFWGTFLWDAITQKVVPIALKQMPATGNLVFQKPGSFGVALNNHGEIALAGYVKGTGSPTGWGLFFQGADRVLRSVLLPGQALPGATGSGRTITDPYFMPSVNDGGAVAFLSRPAGNLRSSAYLWQEGEIEPLAVAGQTATDGATLTQVTSVFLDRDDRNAIITASTNKTGGSRYALYRVVNRTISPVAAPGISLPGGGTFKTIQNTYRLDEGLPLMGVSSPNAKGEYAFLATLTDGSAGAYLVHADGTITRVYQTVPTGTVHIASATDMLQFVPGSRPALNNRGQVALTARTTNGRSLIMLLTPNQ